MKRSNAIPPMMIFSMVVWFRLQFFAEADVESAGDEESEDHEEIDDVRHVGRDRFGSHFILSLVAVIQGN